MPAGEAPTIGRVRETRPRSGRGPSAGTAEARHREQPLDDWLGDVSDDDWDEHAAARSEQRRSTPSAYEDPYADDGWPEPAAEGAGTGDHGHPADARRAAVERRRIVAGGAAVAVLGIAAAALVVMLRDGGSEPSSATTPTVTAPATTDTTPSSTTPTPPPPSATTPTTPSTGETSSFTLPEGMKLRRGEENDPAVVTELQQALTAAGYDPGPADGTYGQGTEAAVVAFQEDNDLAADGVVGTETAAALNTALENQ